MKSTTSSFSRSWPMLIDLDKDECKRMLRRFELQAYASVVTALRAQGDLNLERRKVLRDLADILNIPIERHKCEVRRVLNDERLYTIAYNISGPSVFQEWTIEGKRLIPLIPRIEPTTAFTALANKYAALEAKRNAAMPVPSFTRSMKVKPTNIIAKKSSNEIPAKRAKLSDNYNAKVNPCNQTTISNTSSNNVHNHNNNHNSSPANSVPKRSKNQESKNDKEKTTSRPLSNQSPTIVKTHSLSSSSNPSHPGTGITIKSEALSSATIISAKKLPKISASPVKCGSNELLIKTPENETHLLVPFSVSSSPSISTPARRVISVSPSFTHGTKLSAKPINAQKSDLTYVGGSSSSTSSNSSLISGPKLSTGAHLNSGGNTIITSIVNSSTLTPTIISGNIATQDNGKGNIVNIVPIGTVSQQRILQHQTGSGSSAQSMPGQVLQQQVFVIPAGSTMSDMKSVSKVGAFPVQTSNISGLSNISGDVHSVQQPAQAQQHILQQPKVHSYHPQPTQKIISIPLESTKPNFLSGKPKFTYGMKAMTSAKIQLPVQQIAESVPEKSSQLNAPITLVTSTTASMTSIPVPVTTLPLNVPTIPNTSIASLPVSIVSTPGSSVVGPVTVSAAGLTTPLPKTVSVPVTVTTVSPANIPVSVAPSATLSPKSLSQSTATVTATPRIVQVSTTEPIEPPVIASPPVTVAALPVKPAIMPPVTDEKTDIVEKVENADASTALSEEK